jgi:hypothetical protein
MFFARRLTDEKVLAKTYATSRHPLGGVFIGDGCPCRAPFIQRHNYRNTRDEHLLDTRFDYQF